MLSTTLTPPELRYVVRNKEVSDRTSAVLDALVRAASSLPASHTRTSFRSP
jgi:hypothetical protein